MNFTRANCKDIQSILDTANEKGIIINEVSAGWSESSLSFDMSKPLDDELCDYFLKNYPALKYLEYKGSLHPGFPNTHNEDGGLNPRLA